MADPQLEPVEHNPFSQTYVDPFTSQTARMHVDPFAEAMWRKGISADPDAQTQRGSQAVLDTLTGAGQFVAQPVLDAAHYADALYRGQENWDTSKGLGLGANMAMTLFPFARSGKLAKDAVEAGASALPRVANPIRAYHGSPHDFDAFDISKVNMGQGAQAYGHGLYFAEAEPVAQTYKATSNKVHPGHMYEVNIHADPEHFLDWDKPLSEQSGHLQDVAADLLEKYATRGTKEGIKQRGIGALTGEEVHDEIGLDLSGTSKSLHEAGIPGIRYLDQDSRALGQGTRNYVVFDPRLIEIMRKYAIIPPVIGTAAGLAEPVDHNPFEQ